MKKIKISFLLTAITIVLGCTEDKGFDSISSQEENTLVEEGPLAGLNVNSDFDFATSKNMELRLTAPDFLKSAVFDVYVKYGHEDSLSVGTGRFNANGSFNKIITLSRRADSVLIFSKYAGLLSELRLPIENGQATFDYRPLYQRNTTTGKRAKRLKIPKATSKSNAVTFNYLDTYDANGVPDNMVTPDVIEERFLDDLNASLPENVKGGIPVSNPGFLAGAETQLILTQEADVWVTFVSEGAGYKNTLGYYSYPLGEEPESVEEIEHNIIFPNTSMIFSGGGLVPGDRVLLGRFEANTVISWFLMAQGWRGSQVEKVGNIYYSQPDFNPENTADKRQHMVLLHDATRNLSVLGFEDLFREGGNSDEDFNDAVFYATSNPPDAIQTNNMAKIKVSNDTDGDGVNDELDDYPTDPSKAFNNYAPSKDALGKLAYEDLWPSKGDYDFNDLVVGYNYNVITNADNMVTAIDATFTIEEIGASFENGFAITMPIEPGTITSVQGQVLNGGYELLEGNGTESGVQQDETVIIIAGNTREMAGDTLNINLAFNDPMNALDLGNIPFNPFLIVDGDRTREVHLPDQAPTSKAVGFLGSYDDDSNTEINRFYKSKGNLPWALNIFEGFAPPPEAMPITLYYPRFVNWANSGGTEDENWHIR